MTSDQQRRERRQLRLDILRALGDKCASCGFSDLRALQIDHVNGGGHKDRRAVTATGKLQSYSSVPYYRRVWKARFSGKYQLLCANCNWIKRVVNHEYAGEK